MVTSSRAARRAEQYEGALRPRRVVVLRGINDFKRVGYGGPCPPPGKPNRYYFKLYALDIALLLKPRVTKQQLLRAMDGHILAEARLSGTYQRKR